MNYKKIVICTDFSENSEKAFEKALEIAKSNQASLDVLYVREPIVNPLRTAGGGGLSAEAIEATLKEIESAVIKKYDSRIDPCHRPYDKGPGRPSVYRNRRISETSRRRPGGDGRIRHFGLGTGAIGQRIGARGQEKPLRRSDRQAGKDRELKYRIAWVCYPEHSRFPILHFLLHCLAMHVNKCGGETRKMVGWIPYRIGRPQFRKRPWQSATPSSRPTHPSMRIFVKPRIRFFIFLVKFFLVIFFQPNRRPGPHAECRETDT